MTDDPWSLAPLSEVAWAGVLHRLETRPEVTIAISVFNGGDTVRECLASVVRHSHGARVVVIDDASTDAGTRDMLDELASRERVELVRHDENWGYTRTANHAFELAAPGDVVLLNSDTEVGPNWLSRLALVAHLQARVATVSAISDNAGAMAYPVPAIANDWPGHLTWDEIARGVASRLPYVAQPVPTGHGFCMYVRREAIDAIGAFDVDTFPRGYGEENDFSRRAASRGFRNLLAPQVLVRHRRSVSFGSARTELAEAGMAGVMEKHPDYRAMVRSWMSSPASAELRESIASIRDELTDTTDVKPRVMYVLHRGGGGTPQTNLDLIGSLPNQQSYLLEAVAGRAIEITAVADGKATLVERWEPEEPFRVTNDWREDYAAFLVRVLHDLNIELVHVRHLINQPLTTLPAVLRLLRVPMILSTHDFYMVCPTVHLLDERDEYCGGVCTPGQGRCRLPSAFVAEAPADLKHGWIYVWRERARAVLESARAVICTTESAANVYRRAFPSVRDRILVVEHGREAFVPLDRTSSERRAGPYRILAAAQWDPHKGVAYLRSLARALGPRVEWHVLGPRSEQLADVGVAYGAYRRNDFPRLAKEIDPDLVAVLSAGAETYSHTVTEAWGLGIPVAGNDLGAVAERIRAHGGGFLLPARFTTESARVLEHHLSTNLTEVPPISPSGIRAVVTMAEDYRTLVYPAVRTPDHPVIGVATWPGRATTHIRVGRRSIFAERHGMAVVRETAPRDIASGADATRYQGYLIQRDAVDPADAEALVAALRRQGTHIALEIDDDLVTDGGRGALPDDYDEGRLDALRFLLEHGDQIIVSTVALASAIASLGISSPIAVMSNRLDPRLWMTGRPAGSASKRRPVYIGTTTHGADLELIADLPGRLSELRHRRTEIDVIGVSAGPLPAGMRRVGVPTGAYPGFVEWLRSQRSRWSVGLAPLADSPINESKSDLKLLDYCGLDLAAVASDRGPYRGRRDLADLVGDDPDHWAAAVSRLLDDDAASAARVRQSREILKTRLLDRASVEEWVSLITGSTSER